MMPLPDKEDAIHKAWLYRIVEAIADDGALAGVLYFKGGTCAAMLGWLPRFSVDLDFDYAGAQTDIPKVQDALLRVFRRIRLRIRDKSKNGIQYFLKYEPAGRNMLKLDASFPLFRESRYAPQRLSEIDRVLVCQTKETMFAHKLVAAIDRFEKTERIAGRDIFDIHHFFMHGFPYDAALIEERRGVSARAFLTELHDFVKEKVPERIISEDLNSLLPPEQFAPIRRVLKREVLSLLQDEIRRLG
jgi:predicted nucleotidyltransferase component of viral defense system